MKNKSFGTTMRDLRKQKNLSVKEVIEELKKYGYDITDKTLYSYENNTRAASADMFIALCQIYGCNNILEFLPESTPDYTRAYKPDDNHILKKYHELNAHGKEIVDYVLQKEWENSITLIESTRRNRNPYYKYNLVAEESTYLHNDKEEGE